jgi:hypothetical protein
MVTAADSLSLEGVADTLVSGAEKATDPAKKDQAPTNDELDKVSSGKGPAPVKLPFDIEQ